MGSTEDSRRFEFGGFRLDAAQRSLHGPDGAPIQLPSRAFDVLLFLVERPGELIDKSVILKAVWPTTVVEEGNLSQCIYTLRRALGDDASEHRFIATVPGRGYQFVASLISPSPAEKPRSRSPVRVRLLLGGVAAVVVAASYLLWPRTPTTADTAHAGSTPTSIAVLPFVDLSADKDMEYFADGLAEELMTSLAASGRLSVVGRRSAFAFKGTKDDTRVIGEKLGVGAVLEGSVRKEGQRIRITAQLLRAQDGFSLWTQTYDRAFDDVLDIQAAIAREISATLVPQVGGSAETYAGAARDARQTNNPEAYRAFLRGLYFHSRFTHTSMPLARDEFLRATTLDPDYARAHAWLGRAYALLARRSLGDIETNQVRASAAFDRALQLDPALGEIWWVRAQSVDGDEAPHAVRARYFERALVAAPGDPDLMMWLASIYMLEGRRADALQMVDKAHTVDPLWPQALISLANVNARFGDRRRSSALLEEMRNLAPNDPRSYSAAAVMARASGKALEWDRWNARAIEAAPLDAPLHGYLSLDYVHLGLIDAARHHARMSGKLNPESAAGLYNDAYIRLYSGDIAGARPIVERARREKPADYLSQLALAELRYFEGDCSGSLESLLGARPAFSWPSPSLNLFIDQTDVPTMQWCLRQLGRNTRADEVMRVFNVQYAPPYDPGINGGLLARMAAANGDRDALVRHLKELVDSGSMAFAFVRHEPMIQPYLKDSAVIELLDVLEARRLEWVKILPKASMRVPVP
jgi:TolB-like protein/DNA-binding winged helix-turn-helix (wHTH) protein/Flp pilus assembly protein TadD